MIRLPDATVSVHTGGAKRIGLGSLSHRGVGSYPSLGSVRISVCTKSRKLQKENVHNISWPTTLILGWGGGGKTHSDPLPNFFIWGHWALGVGS